MNNPNVTHIDIVEVSEEAHSTYKLREALKKFITDNEVEINNCDFGSDLYNELDDWIARANQEIGDE